MVNGLLDEHENLLAERRRLLFPESPVRPRKALDPDQALRLLEAASRRGIVPHALVAFERLMGLRRSEVHRVSLADLGDEALKIHGKGRAGGKTRWVPYHSEVRRILPNLLVHRAEVMEGFRGGNPGRLFVHRTKSGTVRTSGLWHVDERLKGPAFEDAGIRMPWNLTHAVRRTFGRTLWTKGVPLEVISDLLGRQDTKTTIRYLALRNDGMVSAMRVLDQALPPLRFLGHERRKPMLARDGPFPYRNRLESRRARHLYVESKPYCGRMRYPGRARLGGWFAGLLPLRVRLAASQIAVENMSTMQVKILGYTPGPARLQAVP